MFTLGHAGRRYLSEDELYAAALEREPDATPEPMNELQVEAGKNARHNVAFYDLTFNVQESITLMHTAFEAQQVAAERAGDTVSAEAWGVPAGGRGRDLGGQQRDVGLYERQRRLLPDRASRRGRGRWIDAGNWVVASFFQHDSREHDPHLHIYNAFLNRVLGEDGVWRTIDSRALYKLQRAAAAVGERLTQALGVLVATRPDGQRPRGGRDRPGGVHLRG